MPARERGAELLLDDAGARGRGRVAVSGMGERGRAKHARRASPPFAPMARLQNRWKEVLAQSPLGCPL